MQNTNDISDHAHTSGELANKQRKEGSREEVVRPEVDI